MRVMQYQREMRRYLRSAKRLLGQPAVPLYLSYALRNVVLRHARHIETRGLAGQRPWWQLTEQRQGHWIYVGLRHYVIEINGRSVPLVYVAAAPESSFYDFWAVGEKHVRMLYRFLRRQTRVRKQESEPPIMPSTERQRLWANTIGILRRSEAALARFGVATRRGVLLWGDPGNGKTMACRWLAEECRRQGLEWSHVSAEDYAAAAGDCRRSVRELFDLPRPGVIVFDDFDEALQDRRRGLSDKHQTFLSELDGVRPKNGVVYVFTTNRRLNEIDPAIRRPGRIDVVIEFSRPAADLRKLWFERTWCAEMKAALDLWCAVADTHGMTFAELEELRTLLVMHYLDTDQWDWEAARQQFALRRQETLERRPIGFHAPASSTPKDPAIAAGPVIL